MWITLSAPACLGFRSCARATPAPAALPGSGAKPCFRTKGDRCYEVGLAGVHRQELACAEKVLYQACESDLVVGRKRLYEQRSARGQPQRRVGIGKKQGAVNPESWNSSSSWVANESTSSWSKLARRRWASLSGTGRPLAKPRERAAARAWYHAAPPNCLARSFPGMNLLLPARPALFAVLACFAFAAAPAVSAPGPAVPAVLVSQAPPSARAVDGDYWRRRAEQEEADRRKARRYYLGLSQLTVAPDHATQHQDVVVKAGLSVQGLPPNTCPQPAGVTLVRQERTFRVRFPVAPCDNPYAFNASPVELRLGRLEPGRYVVQLEVPNELGLEPVKSLALDVRAVTDADEAFMIAVTESAADVAQWLARHRFSRDRLDTALNLACGSAGGRNGDDPTTVRMLLAAGAQPNAAIHQAAQAGPRCLAELIAAKADVNVDIAATAGSLISYTGEGPRFKVGLEGPPLLYAVRARNVETARLLLAAGADPNREFALGRSPYAETFAPNMPDDERTRSLRAMMEARGASRSLAQRARAGAQRAMGAAQAGGFMTACLLSVLFGGQCH